MTRVIAAICAKAGRVPRAAALLAAVTMTGQAIAEPSPLLHLVQNNRISWTPWSNGETPLLPFAGGRDTNGQALYVCAASHNGGRHPGKVNASLRGCNFGYGGREITARNYMVLTAMQQLSWTPSSGGSVPRDALRSAPCSCGR